MIEPQLMQYGVFGIWTAFNIYLIKWFINKQDAKEEKLLSVIDSNTRAIIIFNEKHSQGCFKRYENVK
jgi:hypothetical protein